MMRRQDYFELIDKYLNGELSGQELKELEAEMLIHDDLFDELSLHREIEEAVREKDIIQLRRKLQRIIKNQDENNQELVASTEISIEASAENYNFGLAEEMASYKDMEQFFTPEELLNFQSMPKMHLFQHEIAAKENIHQFYKEQNQEAGEEEYENLSQADEVLFSEVEKALNENDVMALRANLQKITTSLPEHAYSDQEIDDYITGLMDGEKRAAFEQELTVNASLAKDLELHKDIHTAAAENDIMELRASIRKIQKAAEHEKLQQIEQFTNQDMRPEELAVFEEELANNPMLAAEIELSQKIDKAAQEKDVMELRAKLSEIVKEKTVKDKQQKRAVGTRLRIKRIAISSAVAASLVLMIGIASLVSRNNTATQPEELYQQFYSPYETAGIFRSGDVGADQTLTMALQQFNSGEYEKALTMFSQILEKDQNDAVGHFYAGMSLQEIGKYRKAIREYESVINNRDNLFVEQAQWYIGLCYLQTNERRKAYDQLKKIAESKSFYSKQAKAIIRKLKFIE